MSDLLAKFRLPEPEGAAPYVPPPRPPASEIFGLTSVAYAEEATLYTPGKAIGDSRDLHRVHELPMRERPDLEPLVKLWTDRLGKGEVQCRCQEQYLRRCAKTLLPVQAWALEEINQNQGLLGPIGVGDGKTLLDLLAPMVMPGCKVALLLIPPNLREQLLEVDWGFYAQHWNLPNLVGSSFAYPGRPWLHVVAYSQLSGEKATDLLERINPDLIIADEAQNIRNFKAVRTDRFRRHFRKHPQTRLCCWSGTLTSKSLKDYAHLSNLALREKSPTPLHWPTVEEWAGAIDPADFPSPIGDLKIFCREGESIWAAWQRRLNGTAGVVSSPDKGNCKASLIFTERRVVSPPEVEKLIAQVHATWQRPDGEELVDALSKARCARQLACGFYYRWRWPRGESLEVIERWLAARKAWHKELREKLKFPRPHLDSPLLCAKAAIRFYSENYEGDLPVWEAETWPEWVAVRDTAQPETEAVWVDEFLAQDAADWLKRNTGILWYEHDAFGQRVAELSGCPLFGPGEDASRGLLLERGQRAIIASIRAHGTGKNLQPFSVQLVANPPQDGATWEQLIGRTHRQGQLADSVSVEVYRHTPDMIEALDRARLLASYIQGTMGGEQKLLRATFAFG